MDDPARKDGAAPASPEQPAPEQMLPSPAPEQAAPAPAPIDPALAPRPASPVDRVKLAGHKVRQKLEGHGLVAGAIAISAVAVVVGVNLYAVRGKGGAAPAPSASTDHHAHRLTQITELARSVLEPPTPLSAPSPNGSAEGDSDGPPEVDSPDPDDGGSKHKGAARNKKGGTVFQAAARSCSTSSVDGLTRQIIAQARCSDPDAFAPVPARPNLVKASHVLLFLEAPARDRLIKVLDAHKDRTMKVHSALRTVAQQYLLSRWANGHRCGIQLATPPGESNHETGLALDIGDPKLWKVALEEQQFKWLGPSDRVHFDYKGPGAKSHLGLDVKAFQELWNRNHPDDRIDADGTYDSGTEVRLKQSPASGFPAGASCGDTHAVGGSARARSH